MPQKKVADLSDQNLPALHETTSKRKIILEVDEEHCNGNIKHVNGHRKDNLNGHLNGHFNGHQNGHAKGLQNGQRSIFSRQNQGNILQVSDAHVTLEEVILASQGAKVQLSRDPEFLGRVSDSHDLLQKLLNASHEIYGVTTSYGDSCTVSVPKESCLELNRALLNSFACALGPNFDNKVGRAVLFTRLVSLAKGYSGIRIELLEQLVRYLTEDIIPVIPEEGSVGASGDLMPLSYIAAALTGERKVYHRGEVRNTAEVLKELGIAPLKLGPKEGLGIMNGTTVMTAVACMAWKRAEYLSRVATRITSLTVLAMLGNKDHFHPRLMALKQHKGQIEVGAWIYSDLHHTPKREKCARLQDRYSLRCAPHVIGVLRDALVWMRCDLENELNSVNDNPVLDADSGLALSGGHFYGGHVAFAMDSLKNAVASVADLLDRQLALLVDVKFNNGLPSNLTGAQGARAAVSLGMKALQISVSSYTAEALNLALPTTIFSRSTECHNQDKVSMGTISARHATRILTLTEQTAAGVMVAAIQALDLRMRDGMLTKENMGPDLATFYDDIRTKIKRLDDDRPLENDLKYLLERFHNQDLYLYRSSI